MNDITRQEFDAWTRRIEQNAAQAAGLAVVSAQMTEVIKDVSDVRAELRDHRGEHERESTRRTAARRWGVGIAAVLFAAVESPLLVLLIHIR